MSGGRKVVERREIDGERAYPCYTVRATFSRARTEEHATFTEPHWQVEGRPDRFRDTSSMTVMERDVASEARLAERVAQLVASYLAKHPDAEVLDSGAEMTHWETWCLTWFSHFTFPEGRSDAELVASFSRYVARHEWYQNTSPRWEREDGEYAICLMGAEDRWRWRNGDGDHDNPICRCAGCEKFGVVRVSH